MTVITYLAISSLFLVRSGAVKTRLKDKSIDVSYYEKRYNGLQKWMKRQAFGRENKKASGWPFRNESFARPGTGEIKVNAAVYCRL